MDSDHQEQIHKALQRAYHFLKFRPRSKDELKQYLQKKAEKYHWNTVVQEKTLRILEEQKFIDDRAFLEWYVEQRTSHKPRAARAIKYELARFRIDPDLLQQYFTDLKLPEDSLALHALEQRWSRYNSLDRQKRFEKAAAFLSRRGFSFGSIKKAIAIMEGRE